MSLSLLLEHRMEVLRLLESGAQEKQTFLEISDGFAEGEVPS